MSYLCNLSPWETFVYRPIFVCLYPNECTFGTRLGRERALASCKYKRFFFLQHLNDESEE